MMSKMHLYLPWTLLLLMVTLTTCGTTPLGGLEGEYCTRDSDCSQAFEEMVCEHRICLPLSLFDQTPERGGLFFTALQLGEWEGATGGNLAQLAQFITDLSIQLYPYYAVHALSQSNLRFGMVDRSADPIVLDGAHTVTSLPMRAVGSAAYLAEVDSVMIPMYYRDDSIDMAFDLPLMDAELYLYLPDLNVGSTAGVVQLMGYLRAEDTLDLWIQAGQDTYTLFDVLRNDPLDVDSDDDGIDDSWWMEWSGETVVW